jgi:hypothetical protein
MLLAVTALAMVFAFCAPRAFADTFTYAYSDSTGVSATGTLTGNLVASGEYLITSGTIDLTGAPACNNCGALNGPLDGTGTISSPPPQPFQVGGGTQLIDLDNLLFPGADPQLDTNGGLAFQMSDGLGIGIGGNGPDNYWIFGGNWTLNDNSGSFSATEVTATPEPSSLFLLGTGLLGMAGLLFRKAKKASLQPRSIASF